MGVKQVKEFYSHYGGLPALECANNPLGFKFSWSPRGAIMSQMNSASFILGGKRVDIAAKDLMSHAKPYFVQEVSILHYHFACFPISSWHISEIAVCILLNSRTRLKSGLEVGMRI